MRSRNLYNIPDGVCKCSICFVTKPNTEFPYYLNQFYNKGLEHPWTGKRKRVNTNCYACTKVKAAERSVIDGAFVWQLDHCHETGDFRGWLCKKCNTGLGLLGDNVTELSRAIKYLSK